MSDDNDNAQTGDMGEDVDKNYKPPPQVSLEEILEKDKEDESLRRYKEALLGGAATTGNVIVDENDPRRVIVKKLALVVDGMPDKELDLTGDLSKLKQQKFKIKEGIQYRLRIDFVVQREIVHGLKYIQKTSRKGIPVDTMSPIMGSYAPKAEVQSFTTVYEEAPSGMLYRGDYSVASTFTDDDKNIHLKWDWKFEISKDW
jgi:Rho GDP-dissociation inhibitor